MSDGRRTYARMRSILEVPILNPKFWSKVPTAAADAIMIDLEDSAAPTTKELARAAAVEWLGRPDYFGGRTVIVRVNNLSTPWALDDLQALAEVETETDFLVCYPKVESADELTQIRSVLTSRGRPERGLHVMIETARALIEIDRIASADGVVGLHFGYVDMAADVGSRPFADDGLFEPANYYPRSKISLAAAAYGLFATGGSLIPDYKDLNKVRAFVQMWRDIGFTACIAVSPAHLGVINEVMSPSPAEIKSAREICVAYEEAMAAGQPAAMVNGKVVTMPDFRVASLVLARSGTALPAEEVPA